MVGHISVMCPSMEAIVVGTVARFVALTMVTTCYVVDSLEAQGQERSKGLKFIVYIYKYDATQNLAYFPRSFHDTLPNFVLFFFCTLNLVRTSCNLVWKARKLNV